MKIPIGTEANIILPLNHSQKIEIKKGHAAINPKEIDGLQTGDFKLKEGDYLITISLAN